MIVYISIIILLITLLIVLIVAVFSLKSENVVLNKVISPNGNNVAITFIRDVGATTRASYQLCILKNDEKFTNDSKGIYVSYEEFEVEWIDDENIRVHNISAQNIFKQKRNYHSIGLLYDKYRG